MTAALPLMAAGSDTEIALLVETVRVAERRLEELTAGQVDSLIDSDGRTLVLRRAQDELRHAEATKQAALLDSLPAHAALIDADGVIVTVNAAWSRFARNNGLQGPASGVGVNYLHVCDRARGSHADGAAEAAAGIRAVLAGTAKSFSFEYACHSPNAQRWYLLTVSPMGDDRSRGAVLMHIDVTARTQATSALTQLSHQTERRERLLNITFSSISDFAYAMDRKGRFLFVNKSLLDVWGLTLDAAIGKDFLEVGYSAESAAVLQREVDLVVRNKEKVLGDFTRVDSDGKKTLYEYVFSPAFADDGTVDFVVGCSRDVTERRKAEAALHEKRNELRVLFDLVPAMIWFKDTQNNIIRVNQRAADLTGLSVGEIEGRPSAEIYPEGAAAYYAADLEVIHSEQPKRVIERVPDGKGNQLWVQTDKVPYRDARGNVIGLVVMAQDITDRKSDQDALKELNNELEARVASRTVELNQARIDADQASKAKSAFLASMSHEIRTPMNGVIGMMDVLNQTSLQEHQVEMVDLVRDSAYSLLGIIDNILDFSKIEAGKFELDIGPVQLRHVVEKVCGMLDHLAVKSDVGLMMFVDPAIPRTILADETRLRQVLLNLVGNAIKFSGGRGQRGQVSVRAVLALHETDSVTVDLFVTDNGIGMDAETLERLFAPFTQADVSTTRRFGGTGLGLVISEMLVRLMEGIIVVDSAPEVGSTFTIRLRFATPDAQGEDGHTDPLVAGLQCLIVGDDAELAGDLSEYLTHAGAVTERALSLEAAAATGPGRRGKRIWILLPGHSRPLTELRAMAATPGGETAFVVLGRGKRRRARVEASDLVTIDTDALSRRALFQTLAVASGRSDEEVSQGATGKVTESERAPLRSDAMRQGRLILVAEDNETNRKVIMQQLQLIGFAAEVAFNGRDALARWRSGDFALLLTDLHMPEMDGYQLTAAVRAEEKGGNRAPIIALTANALRDEEKRCLEAGMNAYLTKPVRLPLLKAVMEEWLATVPHTPTLTVAEACATPVAAPLDLAVLRQLVGDDEVVIAEVLKSFQESAEQSGAEIRRGCSERSMPAVVDAAHRLKSGARAVGALRLGDICAEIEQKAPSLEPGALESLLARFDAELGSVYAHLDSLRHGDGAGHG